MPSALLIGSVLGGIYAGWFTATEAGAIGATLALGIAVVRRKLDKTRLWQVLIDTGRITVSVSFLIICANVYMRMLAMSGAPQFMLGAMAQISDNPYVFLSIYVVFILLLGTIIDSSSILLIVVPLAMPVAEHFDMNLIWFGIITVMAVEVGLLTPPFGLSIYVIKSTLADPGITLGDIFRGTMPFVLVMLTVLGLLIAMPQLTLILL